MEKKSKVNKKVPMKNKAGKGTPEEKKEKVKYTNKQRCLVLASRGISYRTRHLMKDLEALMPQYKKDVKVGMLLNG
ncbi:hypothetical protein JH06_5875 [Blastocystis sp. subtype 4]|uniref:hypothetical protein n=1 Tax=Blastocystis sp. subtype 4 TaxID=944170 RepID=UPI000711F4E7|nr:hypothetical protein JH06_5875 [Blastocystis sp. subtype 4]KNB41488.1 hypothetical protein JH06_5875 [Blastocystis sp. subtype 4]|eukprot:XP_014524931.1 hypothetical protein JH06_5875 [Blastocystis sp. subtype 4]